ncbi:MAG: hypothetical protein SGARI_000121 [Bacillariaceae sp.]
MPLSRRCSVLLFQAHQLECRSGRSQSIREWLTTIVGGRYIGPLETQELSDLPIGLQTSFATTATVIRTTDRGNVRNRNDKNFDARMSVFAGWLDSKSIDKSTLITYTADDALKLLVVYLFGLRDGSVERSSRSTGTLGAATLRCYLQAAAHLIHIAGSPLPQDFHYVMVNGNRCLHGLLTDQLSQTSTWEIPRGRYEPITEDMILALRANALRAASQTGPPLPAAVTICDAVILAVFTGSRLAEYGQGSLKAGQSYTTVPANVAAKQFAGYPIAFTSEDFCFFDRQLCEIPHDSLASFWETGRVHAVEVRFRYDKSATNFSHRKFFCTGHEFICPVAAATGLVVRGILHGIAPNHPICVHSPLSKRSKGTYSCLRDYTVSKALQEACIDAYPDSNHSLRCRLSSLTCHSLRVTAAVCLSQAQYTLEQIAFKLRWKLESVPTYLRDVFQSLGRVLAPFIRNAYGDAS